MAQQQNNDIEEVLVRTSDDDALALSAATSSSGRSTLFCCLSCGIPFAFPDSSYTSDDKDVKDIITFVHKVRREIRKDDRSKASTMQWLSNKCHYIHKFLHGNMLRHICVVTDNHKQSVYKEHKLRKKEIEALKDCKNEKLVWSNATITACNNLIGCLRFSQGSSLNPPMTNLIFSIDEDLMEYTSDCCNACNTEATNHYRIKELLFSIRSKTWSMKQAFMPFADVPMPSTLPLGMRLMHDAYVFIYVICGFIAVMIKNINTGAGDVSDTKVCVCVCVYVYMCV
jgi:hypothetical protein